MGNTGGGHTRHAVGNTGGRQKRPAFPDTKMPERQATGDGHAVGKTGRSHTTHALRRHDLVPLGAFVQNRHACLQRLDAWASRYSKGSYLRLIDSCITQLKARGASRTCKESTEEEEVFERGGVRGAPSRPDPPSASSRQMPRPPPPLPRSSSSSASCVSRRPRRRARP